MRKNQNSEEITPREVAQFIKDLKYWILASLAVFLIFAWVYTRNAEKIYTATAKVFLDLDERYYNTIVSDEFAEIQRVTMPKTRTKVDYEMSILQSIPVIMSAVESKAMNIKYFTKPRREKEMELYGSKVPVVFAFCDLKLDSYPQAEIELTIHDTATYSIESMELKGSKCNVDKMKKIRFGDTVSCRKYNFLITLSESEMSKIRYEELKIEATSSINMAYSFLDHLTLVNKPVSQNIKLTNMVSIQFQNQNAQRSKDFVNALIDNYNAITFQERRDDILNTINIIDKRLEELAKDSSEVMPAVQHYPNPQVENSLVQYLIQVREESLIALKSVSPTARVVDKASCSRISAKPNPKMVYIAAVFFGIFLPIIVEILRRTFRTKVLFRKDIEQNCDVPILSVLPAKTDCQCAGKLKICSIFQKKPIQPRIYAHLPAVTVITSFSYRENSCESAIRLTQILEQMGKKVLLVDMNFHNDKMEQDSWKDLPQNEGVAAWIEEKISDVSSQVVSIGTIAKANFLPAGKSNLAPNELLQSPRLNALIQLLTNQYDNIILLSAPYSQYVDPLCLNEKERTTLFVMKKSVTKIEELEEFQRISEESLFAKLAVLYCE
jgi:capsular polysaccharide biosynthesis protein